MPTDDPRAAAIEAAARSNFAFQRNSEDVRPLPSWESRAYWVKDLYLREAAASLAKAIPHLLAPIRALHQPVEVGRSVTICSCCKVRVPCETVRLLDAIEEGSR